MILNKLLKLFENRKNLIIYTNYKNLTLYEYVKLAYKYSIIFSIISFALIILILLIETGIFHPIYILLGLLFSIFTFLGIILYFYYYPLLAKEDYLKEIEINLPFFALNFYAYTGSKTNLIDVFRSLSKRKEFGALQKEIQYLVALIDILGYDLISALLSLANRTPSIKFKEFLFGLISVIRSGGNLKDFAYSFAKEALADYEINLKVYSEKASLFITLYSFFFITLPIIFLIIAFLFSYITNNVKILNSLTFYFLVIIPFAYITYLYAIHITQPKL